MNNHRAKYKDYFNKELLVHPLEVADFLQEDVIPIAVCKKEEFRQGHLPNSVYFTREDLEDPLQGYPGASIGKTELEKRLGKRGLSSNAVFLLYDSREGYDAVHLWWLLRLYNAQNKIYILDGGLQALAFYQIQLTTEETVLEPTEYRFMLGRKDDFAAPLERVLGMKPGEILLDTRSEKEYTGETLISGAKKSGRIPGSVLSDYKAAIDTDHTVKPVLQLENLYNKYKDFPVITYCQSGYRSSFTFFVLRELLGFKAVQNYDGSWAEYSSIQELAVENDSYDLIIIGGGSGGLSAASAAARKGLHAAVIDNRPQLGGECLHSGCVPSKALIKAAAEGMSFAKALVYVREVQSRVGAKDSDAFLEERGVDLYRSTARFYDSHTIETQNGSRLKGENIIIATGSLPVTFPIKGLEHISVYTNENIFLMKEKPENLLIVGGGAIGCELGWALHKLGVHIAIVDIREQILASTQEDIAKMAEEALGKELDIHTSTRVLEITKQKKAVLYNDTLQETYEIDCDSILFAAGRKPNIKDLCLEAAHVETENRFIKVDKYLETTTPHIFAIGDVNGKRMFSHMANIEARVVLEKITGTTRKSIDDYKVPFVIFTSPQIYQIGYTSQELLEKQIDFHEITLDAKEIDRFICDDETGFIKILIDSTKKTILGASALGSGSGEWMQIIGTFCSLGLPISKYEDLIVPYPCYSEAAFDILKNADRTLNNNER